MDALLSFEGAECVWEEWGRSWLGFSAFDRHQQREKLSILEENHSGKAKETPLAYDGKDDGTAIHSDYGNHDMVIVVIIVINVLATVIRWENGVVRREMWCIRWNRNVHKIGLGGQHCTVVLHQRK